MCLFLTEQQNKITSANICVDAEKVWSSGEIRSQRQIETEEYKSKPDIDRTET